MRRTLVMVLVVGLLMVGLTPPALAGASKTEVKFHFTTTSAGDPARQWISDGILHQRGIPLTFAVSGDLVGTASSVSNVDLNTATGHGVLFGTFVLNTAATTWEGSFRAKIAGGLITQGTFVGQGDDGTVIRGTFSAIAPGEFDLQAVILDPHGG
jgi:hypothetical protein